VTLVRPLLAVAREDTEAFCSARGLEVVVDPQNGDPRRARAQLRALWPSLCALNPRAEAALAAAADAFADEDALLQAVAVDELRASRLRVDALRVLHPAILRRALLQAANEAGLRPERAHLEAVRRALRAGHGAVDVPGGRIHVVDGVLRLDAAKAADVAPADIDVPGFGDHPWGTRTLRVAAEPPGIRIDLSAAPFPWRVRRRIRGERYRPAGGRTKKVSDLLIDAKVPRETRDRLALLEDAHRRLFWVEGLRPAIDAADGESVSGPAAFISMRPEMDASAATLRPLQRDADRSATMPEAHDEEPR
jgi:tRNA(Ile)-lysidine synthase